MCNENCINLGIAETVEIVQEAGGYCKGYVVDIAKKEEVYKAADVIRAEVGDVSTQRGIFSNLFDIKFKYGKVFLTGNKAITLKISSQLLFLK